MEWLFKWELKFLGNIMGSGIVVSDGKLGFRFGRWDVSNVWVRLVIVVGDTI